MSRKHCSNSSGVSDCIFPRYFCSKLLAVWVAWVMASCIFGQVVDSKSSVRFHVAGWDAKVFCLTRLVVFGLFKFCLHLFLFMFVCSTIKLLIVLKVKFKFASCVSRQIRLL